MDRVRAMMDTRHSIVPGITEQQFEVFMLAVKEAVTEAVHESFASPDCPRQCEDMKRVETDIHDLAQLLRGKENGGGIIERLVKLEDRMKLVLWLATAACTSAIGAVAALIIAIIQSGGLP